jgi:lysophospholipase L1-like esterase
MYWYETEVKQLEQQQVHQPAKPGSVVFYGSSSIRLWTTLAEDFSGLPVVNLGFGGSTLTACSWFFTRLVPPVRPGALVVYAGDNDLGDGQPVAEVIHQFRCLRAQVDAHLGLIPFAFISIKPSPARWHLRQQICQINELVARELRERPHGLFVDVFSRMLEGDHPRTELFAADGLHLSPAGYRLWTKLIWSHKGLLFGLA